MSDIITFASPKLEDGMPDKNVWDDYAAGEIDNFWKHNPLEVAIRSIEAAACVSLLNIGDSMLEVGCGTGRLYEWLHGPITSNNIAYTGLDNSPAMLRLFKKHWPGVPLIEGTATKLPFEMGSFDVVICCEVIRHLEEWKEVIAELIRVAKRTAAFTVEVTEGPTIKKGEVRSGAYMAESKGLVHYQIEYNSQELIHWLLRVAGCKIRIRTISNNKWMFVVCKNMPIQQLTFEPVDGMEHFIEAQNRVTVDLTNLLEKAKPTHNVEVGLGPNIYSLNPVGIEFLHKTSLVPKEQHEGDQSGDLHPPVSEPELGEGLSPT